MSSAAVTVPQTPSPVRPSLGLVGFLKIRPDFIVLAGALPVFILAEWPLIAWGTVAVAWSIQTVIQFLLEAKVAGSDNPRQVIGLLAGGALARAWSVATVLLLLGLFAEDAVLYAIVLTLIVFTVYFVAKVFTRLVGESDAVVNAAVKEAEKS